MKTGPVEEKIPNSLADWTEIFFAFSDFPCRKTCKNMFSEFFHKFTIKSVQNELLYNNFVSKNTARKIT